MLKKYLIEKDNIEKTHKYLDMALSRLKNHYKFKLPNIDHTKFLTIEQFNKFNSTYFKPVNVAESYDPLGTITKTGYAYMYIPDYLGYYAENITKNVDLSNNFSYIILHLVDKLSKMNPVGWIFDLRYNTGGIINSFILGFASIFDNFTVNCKDIKGNTMVELKLEDDHLFFRRADGKIEIISILPPLSKIKIDNVHVLINNETASCGELLTYLLKKQHNATIYGDPSYGLSSWMEYYEINGFDKVADEITLRYPELVFDFSNCDIKMTKIKKYKETPVLSIKPDKENIPYEDFGMF
jgi:hypothetical protein